MTKSGQFMQRYGVKVRPLEAAESIWVENLPLNVDEGTAESCTFELRPEALVRTLSVVAARTAEAVFPEVDSEAAEDRDHASWSCHHHRW